MPVNCAVLVTLTVADVGCGEAIVAIPERDHPFTRKRAAPDELPVNFGFQIQLTTVR